MALAILVMVSLMCAVDAKEASASRACNNNGGIAPRAGTVLPVRAQLLVFDTRAWVSKLEYVARINGKKVPITARALQSGPFSMKLLQIESDAQGTLRLYTVWGEGKSRVVKEAVRYRVKGKATAEARAQGQQGESVQATTRRDVRQVPHTTVEEQYDALVIDLGTEVPALLATVKLRRDAKAAWQTLEVPVAGGDWMDEHNVVRIGALGCESNYSVALLEAGVDVEMTVTLPDGSTRPVELPARLKMPPAPPPLPSR